MHSSTVCRSNLGSIGYSLRFYADKNHEHYPNSFTNLSLTGFDAFDSLVCPSKEHLKFGIRDVDRWSDYILIKDRLQTDPMQITNIQLLAYCKNVDLHGGYVVLFTDGRYTFLLKEEFLRMTNNDLMARTPTNSKK